MPECVGGGCKKSPSIPPSIHVEHFANKQTSRKPFLCISKLQGLVHFQVTRTCAFPSYKDYASHVIVYVCLQQQAGGGAGPVAGRVEDPITALFPDLVMTHQNTGATPGPSTNTSGQVGVQAQ